MVSTEATLVVMRFEASHNRILSRPPPQRSCDSRGREEKKASLWERETKKRGSVWRQESVVPYGVVSLLDSAILLLLLLLLLPSSLPPSEGFFVVVGVCRLETERIVDQAEWIGERGIDFHGSTAEVA